MLRLVFASFENTLVIFVPTFINLANNEIKRRGFMLVAATGFEVFCMCSVVHQLNK